MPTKLGQNFLQDEKALQNIINSADLSQTDFVIEIGPGKGVLTEKLAEKVGQVIAIELDDKLIPFLEDKFNDTPNVKIIHEDILKINLPKLLSNHRLQNSNYKLIANIPYYITSPIIRLFLEQTNQPQEIILMIQKEVAERIVTKPGQMSILSTSVQFYAEAQILFPVSKNSFSPIPKVDSAVIKIIPHKKFEKDLDKKFFRLVKAGFSAKRKTLANNLANTLHLEKGIIEEKLRTTGFLPTVRAQELSLEDWKTLVEIIQRLENNLH